MANQELQLAETSEQVVQQAKKQAELLMDIVEKQKLYADITDKKFLQVEAWELIGAFHQKNAIIQTVEEVIEKIDEKEDRGFKAEAVLKNDNNQIIARAVAYCMRSEKNWKAKPKYQLASMAQTRAISKVFRLKYSFIAALAGYATTPAEEIAEDTIIENDNEKSKQEPDPKLTKARKMTFAKKNELGIQDCDFARYCYDKFDIESRKDMTYQQYRTVYKDLIKGKVQTWIEEWTDLQDDTPPF